MAAGPHRAATLVRNRMARKTDLATTEGLGLRSAYRRRACRDEARRQRRDRRIGDLREGLQQRLAIGEHDAAKADREVADRALTDYRASNH
jgi:hypothetical protein